ncbi:MAG: hypothetical protein QG608_3002 [Actinomycetota bacterium]|nr:hypothetical protein [Actinomycetota bacterium]
MPSKRNQTAVPSSRRRRCSTCRGTVPAGSLVQGECPRCIGLVPLPLRGRNGRFLSFETPDVQGAPEHSDGA